MDLLDSLISKLYNIEKVKPLYDDFVKIQTVREHLDVSSSRFSITRDRLIRKGIVDVSHYGSIKLLLPRFKEYVFLLFFIKFLLSKK